MFSCSTGDAYGTRGVVPAGDGAGRSAVPKLGGQPRARQWVCGRAIRLFPVQGRRGDCFQRFRTGKLSLYGAALAESSTHHRRRRQVVHRNRPGGLERPAGRDPAPPWHDVVLERTGRLGLRSCCATNPLLGSGALGRLGSAARLPTITTPDRVRARLRGSPRLPCEVNFLDIIVVGQIITSTRRWSGGCVGGHLTLV